MKFYVNDEPINQQTNYIINCLNGRGSNVAILLKFEIIN